MAWSLLILTWIHLRSPLALKLSWNGLRLSEEDEWWAAEHGAEVQIFQVRASKPCNISPPNAETGCWLPKKWQQALLEDTIYSCRSEHPPLKYLAFSSVSQGSSSNQSCLGYIRAYLRFGLCQTHCAFRAESQKGVATLIVFTTVCLVKQPCFERSSHTSPI